MTNQIDTAWVDLTAADGHRFRGYRARPHGEEKGRLLVAPEIFGINPHIRSVVDGYAAAGYLTLAPTLFDRAERDVELGYDAAGIEKGRGIMGAIAFEDTLRDVAAALEHLGAGQAAIVGYCWGGTIAWAAASRFPLRAAISYYGGGVGNRLDEVPKVPTLLHFGETDHAIPLSVAEGVRQRHPAAIVHLYPAGHGFNCDARGSYHQPSAELALRRSLGLLQAVF